MHRQPARLGAVLLVIVTTAIAGCEKNTITQPALKVAPGDQAQLDLGSAPAPTYNPVEVLEVDARLVGNTAGPTFSSNVLKDGVDYRITVDGNWSAWPPDWWVGDCSRFPVKYHSPSVPTGDYAGFDAEGRYAAPGGVTTGTPCSDDQRRDVDLLFSLDGGATFYNPAPTSGEGSYNPEHIYEYVVTGQGEAIGFRIPDSNEDDHGVMKVTIEEIIPAPIDDTPPAITPTVTGTLGDNGWYISDVAVSWDVSDAESETTSTSGCDDAGVISDTDDATFTCSATSAGGTAEDSVTIKRDATPPVITFSGNAGSYPVDGTVAISCSATDATSGIASSDCPGASGDAYTFGVGTTTLDASATDDAGNASVASARFTVSVTSGSLCTLVGRWVDKAGVAHAMCQQLAHGNSGVRDFIHHVNAQTGKSVSAAHAAILIALAEQL